MLKKFILALMVSLFLSTATISAETPTFDDELLEFMPPNFEEMIQARREKARQEFQKKIIIGVAVLIVIFIGFLMLRKTSKYQFAKDYFYMQKLINLVKNSQDGEKSVVNEIYAFCITREHLRKIVNKHNATPNDFEKIYNDLMTYCNAASGKMFIPVATFFFENSLEYVLSNRIKSRAAGEKVARNLKNYFDNLRR